MGYDIMMKGDDFTVIEMSYGYSDVAVHQASGYYERQSDDVLAFVEEHTWPEMLWVAWALERWEKQNAESAQRKNPAEDRGS